VIKTERRRRREGRNRRWYKTVFCSHHGVTMVV
jgi:hypothetical protein